MSRTVHHLGVEHGYQFFNTALERSSEAKAIYREMVGYGLEPQPERTHLFNLYSPESVQSLAISITPFSSPELTHEGGLSISQGGHAQGVIVELENKTEIVGFIHLAVRRGKVSASRHDVRGLAAAKSHTNPERRIQALARRAGKVKTARPLVEVEAEQVRSLASIAYNSLISDQFSQTVYDESEIKALRGNTSLVSEIGLFVLFRTSGSSCCSCSCSCWGSSSCSSSYISS